MESRKSHQTAYIKGCCNRHSSSPTSNTPGPRGVHCKYLHIPERAETKPHSNSLAGFWAHQIPICIAGGRLPALLTTICSRHCWQQVRADAVNAGTPASPWHCLQHTTNYSQLCPTSTKSTATELVTCGKRCVHRAHILRAFL